MKWKKIDGGIARELKNGKTLTITGWELNWTLRINGTFIYRFEYMKLAREYADGNFR